MSTQTQLGLYGFAYGASRRFPICSVPFGRSCYCPGFAVLLVVITWGCRHLHDTTISSGGAGFSVLYRVLGCASTILAVLVGVDSRANEMGGGVQQGRAFRMPNAVAGSRRESCAPVRWCLFLVDDAPESGIERLDSRKNNRADSNHDSGLTPSACFVARGGRFGLCITGFIQRR